MELDQLKKKIRAIKKKFHLFPWRVGVQNPYTGMPEYPAVFGLRGDLRAL